VFAETKNADFCALTSAATGKSNGLQKTAGHAGFAGAKFDL
jgi:hypothetical protein